MLMVACHTAHAQLNAQNMTHYTEKDGLPGSEVQCILADRQGYIWIGTNNGLTRFDGYAFKRFYFDPNDSSTIHGIIIESLFEDHLGQIWAGISPSYLSAYDPATKKFRQYVFNHLPLKSKNSRLDEVNIRAICEDNKKRIWLGAGSVNDEIIESTLLYKDEDSDSIKRFVAPDSLVLQNVVRIRKDGIGNIWFLTFSGLFKVDTNRILSKWHTLDTEFNDRMYPVDFQFDKSDHLWIVTNQLKMYDYNTVTNSWKAWPFKIPKTPNEYDYIKPVILIDKKDSIWLGSNYGVQLFHRNTGTMTAINNGVNKMPAEKPVHDLKMDDFGTLWVGYHDGGLIKYDDRPQLKSYTYNNGGKNSLTSGWVDHLIESSDGNIWMQTSGSNVTSGIDKLDTRSETIWPIPFPKLMKRKLYALSVMWENAPGELYLATYTGTLYSFSEKTHQTKSVHLPGIPDTVILTAHLKDSRENEWIAALRSGLYRKAKGDRQFVKYDLKAIPGSNDNSAEITLLYESKKHGLWILTNNGLFLYNYTTDKITRFGSDQKAGDIFVTQDVNSIYEDPQGIVWVGTWNGGLSRYDLESKKIKTYTRDDGLPSMSIQSILGDEKNNALWIGTFDGMSRFDLATQQFSNFSIADGIQSQLFADGSLLKTSGGLFVFGGSNGITIFNPDDVTKPSIPPRVFLTDLKLFNKSVLPGAQSILKKPINETEEITLAHDQNNISIDFIAIHYSNPSLNRYSYQLENFDNGWRDIGNLQTAYYPNLPPGNYVFHVKAANDKGVWNKVGASLRIIVNPPWWKTTWAYMMYGILIILFSVGMNRYLRRRLIEKERERGRARELEQAKEIEKAYHRLEESHEALKSTQSQLIQSEKMASLGELTAGIAHEIQNPLNFVNNFSEVNKEMIAEMKTEIDKGNYEEVKTIAANIESNEEKINQHGRRADAIVKGMLLHSRSGSGSKEPTDINAMADEYLRLSYHGIRAKDSSFNATMKTAFDDSIGKINIVPQDMGRVLLNIYNNAFYAAAEKKKRLPATTSYEPTITVSTKNTAGGVLIHIEDNGNGIPQKALDKIFQPFFTTKPTGQGTGLGLSLSYDIVKAHGGEIKVETRGGEYTAFTIILPS
jgi:signal transduction histidine kinase/ligand-binding sensor domain-containing protein